LSIVVGAVCGLVLSVGARVQPRRFELLVDVQDGLSFQVFAAMASGILVQFGMRRLCSDALFLSLGSQGVRESRPRTKCKPSQLAVACL
jgi:hypothetical protein